MNGNREPVPLGEVIAAVAAAFPVTPERAAANARVLDEEVAAWEAGHVGDDTLDGAA